MKNIYRFLFLLVFILQTGSVCAQEEIFNYKKALTINRTLGASLQSINRTTGEVVLSGSDSRGPSAPNLTFTWVWGDGTSNDGFFPQSKKYADVNKNYVVKVIANYSNTEKDTVEVLVDFVKGKLTPIALDAKLKVSIPNSPFSFSNYDNPSLIPFNDNFFTGLSRADLEYLLQVGASIEFDFVNQNAVLYNDKFEQYMLRDTVFKGAYAIWYSKPVGFGVNEGFLNGDIDFSSLYHEMGHNITLNFPANYNFGGKIDGQANAIFSETMAQIFQYSTGYEVINNYKKYGLDDVYLFKYKTNFFNGVARLTSSYREYINTGKPFTTWNDPATPNDEAFLSFLTTAYKFYEYAEQEGKGYRVPIKRLTQFLSKFNEEWKNRYDQHNNTPAANSFRATMMVAAISHAFQRDLRADFKALNYPVSDSDWAFLSPEILDISASTLDIASPANSTGTFAITSNVNWTASSSQPWLAVSPISGTNKQTVTATATENASASSRLAVITISVNGVAAKMITVTQAGLVGSLSVSTKNINLNYTEGSSADFDVTSNTQWTITGSETWLTVNPAAGDKNAKITLTATLNPLFATRKATVTVKAAGATDQSIEVSQTSSPVTGLVSNKNELQIFPNPVTEIVHISGMSSKSKVNIYSVSGSLLKETGENVRSNEIPVKDLPAGLYIIQVITGSKSAHFKFIKK